MATGGVKYLVVLYLHSGSRKWTGSGDGLSNIRPYPSDSLPLTMFSSLLKQYQPPSVLIHEPGGRYFRFKPEHCDPHMDVLENEPLKEKLISGQL